MFSQGSMSIYSATDFFPSWGPTVEEAKALDPTHPDKIFHHYARGFEKGSQFRNTLTMSGGTEAALLSSSFSYFNQEGVIPNSDYRNISARVNGQFRLSDKLRFNPSLYFINSGGLRVNADRYNEQLSYWSPRHDVKDYINPDGTMKTYGNDNPIYGTYSNRFRDNVNRLLGNAAFTYSPLKWLDLDYKLGMDFFADNRRHTGPGPKGLVGEIPFSDNGLGFVTEDRLSQVILNSIAMATLKKAWTDKFTTVFRAGHEVRMRKYTRVSASGDELDVPELLSLNNTKIRTNTEYREDYRIVSAYGDLALSWNNFLFLDVTGRNEWSSTLSFTENSFFYPSVSLSYVFSDHLKMPNWLSMGKLRASWAETGKDTDPYETSTIFSPSVVTSSGQVIWTRSDTKGDAGLKPERTTSIEFGTDLRFLKGRLGLDFTWYKLNSRDQIIPVAVSPTTGFTSVIINAGEIENKGIEIVLNANPVNNSNFRWDATLNFSRNRNKVVRIREGLTEIVLASHFGYAGSTATMKYVPGYAVGNIYGSSYSRYYGSKTDDGVTVDHSLPLVIAATGSNAGFPVRDGTQRILGNSQPDWIGGITNTFSYKNFTLSFLWETQQGQDRYNQLGNFMSAFGIAKYTENRNTTTTFEGVLPNGTPNTQVVFLGQGVGPDGRNYTAGFYRNVHRTVTENFVEDASWVRLRNLSLSYDFPSRLFRNKVIQGATLTFTGNNLLLFTDYSGYDPETSSFSAGSNVDAFTGFTYPAVRSYLFSVNLNF
jgi:TonB-linked SusC/RagA family outer membrane protein